MYSPQKLRPSHRLDANTTGVQVFTRTALFRGSRARSVYARCRWRKCIWCASTASPETGRNHLPRRRSIAKTRAAAAHAVARPGERVAVFITSAFCVDSPMGTSLLRSASSYRHVPTRFNSCRIPLFKPVCGDPAYLGGSELGDVQYPQHRRTAVVPACLGNHIQTSRESSVPVTFRRPAASVGALRFSDDA